MQAPVLDLWRTCPAQFDVTRLSRAAKWRVGLRLPGQVCNVLSVQNLAWDLMGQRPFKGSAAGGKASWRSMP